MPRATKRRPAPVRRVAVSPWAEADPQELRRPVRPPLWSRLRGGKGLLVGLQPIAAFAIISGIYPMSLQGDDDEERAPPLWGRGLVGSNVLTTSSFQKPFPKAAWTKAAEERPSTLGWLGERASSLLCARPAGLLSPCSTLWWMLPMNGAVLWSCWLTVRDRALQLAALAAADGAGSFGDPMDGHSEHDRYVAIDSILVTATYVLTPILWLEAASGYRRLDKLFTPLMRDFGFLVPRCGPWPGRLAWAVVLYGLALTPVLVYGWLFVVAEGRGSSVLHLPAGAFNVARCFYMTLSLAALFQRLADFAEAMVQELSTEISTGKLGAARLRHYRLAWMDLCAAVDGAVTMPATVLLYMLTLVIMCVFFTFQTIRVVMFGMDALLVTTIACMTFMWNTSGLIICEAAHRAVDTVNHRFQEVLRAHLHINNPVLDAHTERELRFFAHVAARIDVHVNVGGFFYLRRATLTSMSSAIISNLIVLLQFQQKATEPTKT